MREEGEKWRQSWSYREITAILKTALVINNSRHTKFKTLTAKQNTRAEEHNRGALFIVALYIHMASTARVSNSIIYSHSLAVTAGASPGGGGGGGGGGGSLAPDCLSEEDGEGCVGVTGEGEGESGGGAQWNQSKIQTGAVHTHLRTLQLVHNVRLH